MTNAFYAGAEIAPHRVSRFDHQGSSNKLFSAGWSTLIMKRSSLSFFFLIPVLGVLFLLWIWAAGRFLVVNMPEKSDVLVVLAGDHNDLRYKRGLQLLADGYAELMLTDANSGSVTFGRTQVELDQEFVQRTAGPLIDRVKVCPIRGVSTAEEAQDISNCVSGAVSKILLVTSDYHTRRALLVLRQKLPQYHWSIAAVHDSASFEAEHWWQRREWAKTTILEWSKLAWWELVDRWRNDEACVAQPGTAVSDLTMGGHIRTTRD